MDELPTFTLDGPLPAGDYELSLSELKDSVVVTGPGIPDWDAEWRLHLVDNLEVLVRQLWKVGVTEIFADGSFAEDKSHPNDIDGYFECDLSELASGRLEQELNLLDPQRSCRF